jgi:hypothetical protein
MQRRPVPMASRAQPRQSQPQGTPYNPQQGQPFGAWAPPPSPPMTQAPASRPLPPQALQQMNQARPPMTQAGGFPASGGQPSFAPPPQPQATQPPASWGQPIHGQPGGNRVGTPQGPAHGATMFPPPMNPPTQAGPQGQFGPNPHHAGPANTAAWRGAERDRRMQNQYGDFWNQAQTAFPTMTPQQQEEMARRMKLDQERANQQILADARRQGMNQWYADQAAAGQNIKDIGPGYRTNAKNRIR